MSSDIPFLVMANSKLKIYGKEAFLFPGHEELAKHFFEHYSPIRYGSTLDENLNLKPKKQRVCRFCYRKYPEVKFKKKAHIISELLGKNNLLSDFECDECNKRFSDFESDLATYFGHERTMNGVIGKEGLSNFKSPGSQLNMRYDDSPIPKSLRVYREDINDNHSIDVSRLKEGIISFNGRTGGYVPQKVFKALLHIALAMLAEKQSIDYRITYRFLLGKEMKVGMPFVVHICELLNGNYPETCVEIFERITDNKLKAKHVCAIYFQKYVMSFIIPFHRLDYENNRYSPCELTIPPIYSTNEISEDQEIRYSKTDLSGIEKETREFNYSLKNEIDFENLYGFDPDTMQFTKEKLKPEDIKGVIFTRDPTVSLDDIKKIVDEKLK